MYAAWALAPAASRDREGVLASRVYMVVRPIFQDLQTVPRTATADTLKPYACE